MMFMVFMGNRRNKLSIPNFESNLTSAPWSKKMMIFFFEFVKDWCGCTFMTMQEAVNRNFINCYTMKAA